MKPRITILLMILAFFMLIQIVWDDSVKNPKNQPYVSEVAFNLYLEPEEVTQKQFNTRYP